MILVYKIMMSQPPKHVRMSRATRVSGAKWETQGINTGSSQFTLRPAGS